MTPSTETVAIATPSYAGDLERCRLLCASIDRFVTGHTKHYLLVEDADARLFADLAGPRRVVLLESQLLPRWLGSYRDPFALGSRRIWTGPGALMRGVPPLRGWHAQQLRKLALPFHIAEDVVFFADSDVVFLRPFDVSALSGPDGTRLFRRPGAIDAAMPDHVAWLANAADILGRPAPLLPAHDYITHLVSWRSATVRALAEHIERVNDRDWLSAVARRRRFSEYLIYGRYVESVVSPSQAGHLVVSEDLACSFWSQAAIAETGLDGVRQRLAQGEVALGVQSFLGQPIAHLRALFDDFARVTPG